MKIKMRVVNSRLQAPKSVHRALTAVRGCEGVYLPGTVAAQAMDRLSALGFTFRQRLDGPVMMYYQGSQFF